MKIKSKVTGAVIDISDEGAAKLVAAGIYDAVDESSTAESTPARTKKAK